MGDNRILPYSQVRQGDEIFCFVYKYRQRFAVVLDEIATRLSAPARGG